MSSIQTINIVAVVILIIVVVASMLLINRKQLQEVEVIDAALNEIEEMHLEEDIKRLNKMDLAGESLTTLNTWRKSYKEASTKKLPRVQKLVEEAANENATYKLFKARKKIKEAQQIIKPALEDARNTKAVFTELLESNKENQIQYDALIKVYRELRKDVLANSFEYGAAIDQIEDQLASMESDFEEAKNLSSQGDHVEAKRVLSKIRMSLAALQKQ
ncbi:MAG: septation ring formation regulator EzrA, partial [Lactobacillus sp.]